MRSMENTEAKMRSRKRRFAISGLFVAIALLALPAMRAAEPQAAPGSVEFTAMVTPSGGRAEPVMRLNVLLLRKSFAEIQKEAEQSEAKPDLDQFIESLSVSKELKAWMKRTRNVDLNGSEFVKQVSTKDICEVPEFFEAYLARNAGDSTVGFPVSKAKDKDRSENPERYEKAQRDYKDTLRKFVAMNPHTREGLDVELTAINPAARWISKEGERNRHIRERALELAETSYLLAKTETDLAGRGAFANVVPGDYWLSTMEGEATVGDARLRWDVPVPVRPGRITRVTLSNVNAVRKNPK